MGCISGVAKYLLFIFNFLIVVCAIALVAVGGIITYNENKGIVSFTDVSVGGLAIVVGVIIFIIAFLGCCGAIKENSCMLTTYAVIMIILVILHIIVTALAFAAISKGDEILNEEVTKVLKKIFDDYVNNQNDKNKKELIDNVQQKFECCGVEGEGYWPQKNMAIPDSCYKDKNPKFKIFNDGCTKIIKNVIVSNVKYTGGIAIASALVEILCALFACIVKNRIHYPNQIIYE